jgi:hypothetical protein
LIAILDYGSGNIKSAQRAFSRHGAQVEVTSERTNTTIKRIFSTAYDAVYQNEAVIYNPDGTSEPIKARGIYGNNGFHINCESCRVADRLLHIQHRPIHSENIEKIFLIFRNHQPMCDTWKKRL